MARYFNPVQVYFGFREIMRLSQVMGSLHGGKEKRILLLTGSSSLKSSGYLSERNKHLKEYKVFLFTDIPPNPDVADIVNLKKRTDACMYDLILAVGGGSVIDAGKALGALKGFNAFHRKDLRRIIQEQEYRKRAHKRCPLIAVPTTAGTGSEVTSWATVWDKEMGLKYSIEAPHLYPHMAIVDPGLTLNLPLGMTASSALDAISHATEAYWSKNTNEIVRMYAVKAIDCIAKNLENLLDNPHDISLRSKVAYGSLYAGLAFSNTKTTACHSISYPLTLLYGLNHGVAVSVTLGKMLVKNRECLENEDELTNAFGVYDLEDVDEFIQRVCTKAGIDIRLRDYGIEEKDLKLIADKSFTPGRMDNNPVDIDSEYILELLKSIY